MERKIKKVTIEFEGCKYIVEGDEAEKWDRHCQGLVMFGQVHNCNPFEIDPIKWTILNE